MAQLVDGIRRKEFKQHGAKETISIAPVHIS
jgi:hypothetical protein